MNVRDFEYIVEIARSGSILKASKTLFISQPALSQFLKRIEFETGTLLFQRVGHNLVPTFAGEECIRIAKEILFLNNQLDNILSDVAHKNRGEIRFGLPLSRGSYFISSILPQFHKLYPGIKVNIFEEATKILLKKLRLGELDLIIINVTQDEQYEDLQYKILCQEEMILAAPDEFHLETKSFIHKDYMYPCLKPEDWIEFPFIALTEGQRSYVFAEKYMIKHEIKPQINFSIRNLAQAIFAVQQGLGLTICPSMPIDTDKIKYFSLYDSPEGGKLPVGIVYRKDAYISKIEKILIEICSKNYNKKKTTRN